MAFFWAPKVSIVIALSVCPSEITSHFAFRFQNVDFFCNVDHSNLIFAMHVYLMVLHILSGEWLRSSFKVKGKKKIKSKCAAGGIVFMTNTSLVGMF